MLCECEVPCEYLVALSALIRSLTRVHHNVPIERILGREDFLAQITLVALLTRMCTHVYGEIAIAHETLPTEGTLVGPNPRVADHVLFERSRL